MKNSADGRRRSSRLVGGVAAAAFLALAAACSSAPPPLPPPMPLDLSNTSWFGACQGNDLQLGTYTLVFGPQVDRAGTVTVGFPGAAQNPQQIRYTLSGPAGQDQLSLAFFQPWHGAVTRDRVNLTWSFAVGTSPSARVCRMMRQGSSTND